MNNIELQRRLRGLTQRQLGRSIGIDHSLICRYEKGNREVTAEHAALLADALGTPRDTLQSTVTVDPVGTTATPRNTNGEVLPEVAHAV